MGIKSLGYDEFKKRAKKLREIAISYRTIGQFDLGSREAEHFLKENPVAPIIGTICDQQITAEDAWIFPCWLNRKLGKGKLSAQSVQSIGASKIKELLGQFMESKWPSGMTKENRENYLENTSNRIIDACRLINEKFGNDPDSMFKEGKYTTPEIYFILRALPGIGPKKASMIARDFAKMEGWWYEGIKERLKEKGINFIVERKEMTEVPVDVHIIKVYGRLMGEFINTRQREKFLDYWPDIQNFAKIAFPEFPGRIDEIFWDVGRNICHERQPSCDNCPLKKIPCSYATK